MIAAAPHRCPTGTRRSSGTSPPGAQRGPQGFRGVQKCAMESSRPKKWNFYIFYLTFVSNLYNLVGGAISPSWKMMEFVNGKDYPQPFISYSGWWLTRPSEKYDFVNWDDDIPSNYMENTFHVPNQQPGFGMIWIWRDLRIPIFR